MSFKLEKPLGDIKTKAIERVNILAKEKITSVYSIEKQLSLLSSSQKILVKDKTKLTQEEKDKLSDVETKFTWIETIVSQSNIVTDSINSSLSIEEIYSSVISFKTFLETL